MGVMTRVRKNRKQYIIMFEVNIYQAFVHVGQ